LIKLVKKCEKKNIFKLTRLYSHNESRVSLFRWNGIRLAFFREL